MWSQALAGAILLAGAGCSTRCGLVPCDIRDPDCQRRTAEGAACLRGVAPLEVPVVVVPRHQFGPAPGDGSGVIDLDAWITAMGLLELGSPDLRPVDLAVEQTAWVGGQYSPETKTIVVIDDGEPLDSLGYVGLLAHEYVHALQDRDVDLAAFDRRTIRDTDSALAAGALVEGEAALVEDLAALAQFGSEEGLVPWTRIYQDWQRNQRRNAEREENPVLLAGAHFRYAFGASVVRDLRTAGGWDEVRRLYDTPPVTTRQVLAAVEGTGFAPEATAVDLGDQAVPDLAGFAPTYVDRYGSWLLEVFLQRQGADAFAERSPLVLSPQQVGQALLGDVLSVWRSGDSVVVCWRLRLTGGIAGSVAQWLQRRRFNAWVPPDNAGDLVIVETNDTSLATSLTPALPFKAAPSPKANPGGSPGPRGVIRCRARFDDP
jgi:hypothetical protein